MNRIKVMTVRKPEKGPVFPEAIRMSKEQKPSESCQVWASAMTLGLDGLEAGAIVWL